MAATPCIFFNFSDRHASQISTPKGISALHSLQELLFLILPLGEISGSSLTSYVEEFFKEEFMLTIN